MSKKGLGRGLSALLGEEPRSENKTQAVPDSTSSGAPKLLAIDLLAANPDQPRRHFDDASLLELSQSIADKGVLQPILVRPMPNEPGLFEIVAGERRWRAAQKAQLHRVPVVVQDLSDTQAFEIALIENIQRQDLTPIEEARAFQQLVTRGGHSQETVGQAVGKSRSHVTNILRLLTLPEKVQAMVDSGELSMGHARALIGATDALKLARVVIDKGLSVRETEALAKQAKSQPGKTAPRLKLKDPDTRALEADISQTLGLKVEIDGKGKGGTLKIQYKSLEQLDDICQRLCQYPNKGKGPGIRGF